MATTSTDAAQVVHALVCHTPRCPHQTLQTHMCHGPAVCPVHIGFMHCRGSARGGTRSPNPHRRAPLHLGMWLVRDYCIDWTAKSGQLLCTRDGVQISCACLYPASPAIYVPSTGKRTFACPEACRSFCRRCFGEKASICVPVGLVAMCKETKKQATTQAGCGLVPGKHREADCGNNRCTYNQ